MRHRHLFENRYCTGCQCTTRHEARTEQFLCLRCGVVKYPAARISKPTLRTIPLSA